MTFSVSACVSRMQGEDASLKVHLKVPGRHNVLNALAVWAWRTCWSFRWQLQQTRWESFAAPAGVLSCAVRWMGSW